MKEAFRGEKSPAGPVCPRCGAEVREDDIVCPSCGAPLPTPDMPSA